MLRQAGEFLELGADVRTLVWIQTGFLGDIILTTAAFRWVRQHYPAVTQILITTPLGARALAQHPDLDEILVFDKRGKSFLSAVAPLQEALRERARHETVVLQAHRSARSSLLAWRLGFPVITYEETRLSWLAKRRVARIATLHETQRILLLLEALGVSRRSFWAATPFLTEARDRPLGQTLKDWAGHSRLVGIAPGSVWGTKRWPQEYFKALATQLLARPELKLVLIGSREEEAAAACVAEAGLGLPDRLMNLAGQTNLDDLRALFPRLELLISNDSSPLHYASAFGVKSLAIFGATVPGLGFGPLSPGSRIAELDMACRPCSDHGPQTCPLGHFRCMREQTPEHVYQIAIDILEGTSA